LISPNLTNNLAARGITNNFGTNSFGTNITFGLTNQFGSNLIPIELRPMFSDLQSRLLQLQPLLTAIANDPRFADLIALSTQNGAAAITTPPASTSGANFSTALGANVSSRLGVNAGANLSTPAGGTVASPPVANSGITPGTTTTTRSSVAGTTASGIAPTVAPGSPAITSGTAVGDLFALKANVDQLLALLNAQTESPNLNTATTGGFTNSSGRLTTTNRVGTITNQFGTFTNQFLPPLTPTGR
jgi:hypothetical protein